MPKQFRGSRRISPSFANTWISNDTGTISKGMPANTSRPIGLYIGARLLYADVEAYQDGTLEWSAPRDPPYGHFGSFRPRALLVAEAMEQVGMFTTAGLKAVSDIWGSLEYREKEDHHDGRKLTEQLLTRLHAEGLILDTAKAEHAGTLYNEWQIPMYNLEFSLIPVSLEELEAEQEREFWSMAGDPR